MRRQTATNSIVIVMLAVTAAVGIPSAQADPFDLYATISDDSLVLVDADTPALGLIGDIGEFSPRTMTYDFANEIIYAIDLGDSVRLAEIDPISGAGTYLGAVTLPEPNYVGRIEALAYNAVDGLIYCSVSVNDYNATSEALGTLDPLTLEVTILGQFSGTLANDGDAMVFIDGDLYLVDDPHPDVELHELVVVFSPAIVG